MLFVLEPFTNVGRTISVFVSALSVCLVVQPHTLVYIPISMHKSAQAIRLIVFPKTVVSGTVRPNLLTSTMLLVIQSIARVD